MYGLVDLKNTKNDGWNEFSKKNINSINEWKKYGLHLSHIEKNRESYS